MSYQPQPGQPIIMMQGPTTPPPNVYGQTSSINVVCAHCKANAPTRTKCSITMLQWLICVILFIIGCPCPCIPCYIPSCYKMDHFCSSCNTYNRFKDISKPNLYIKQYIDKVVHRLFPIEDYKALPQITKFRLIFFLLLIFASNVKLL